MAIDPGHGGEDAGAKGPKGLREKETALELALALKESLEGHGFEVFMTRADDTFVPLWDRAKLANDAGADLFISLHLNGAKARSAKGSEVFFLSLDQGDRDAAELVEVENSASGPHPVSDSVLDTILQDLAQKAYLQESERLAVNVQLELNRLGGIKERGVKQAGFVVLRGAAMPAVLVEVSFISNPVEEAKLKDPAFRRNVAEAVAKGVRRFFGAVPSPTRRRAAEGA